MPAFDYAAANAAFRKFKSALTRAKNAKDPHKVIKVANDFEKWFEARGWPLPDDWALFDVARRDAVFELRRREPFFGV